MPSPEDHQELADEVVYGAILGEAAPIGELPRALDAELVVSALLGGVYATAQTDRDQAVRRFGERFGRYLAGQDTAPARAVGAALGALLTGEPGTSGEGWAALAGQVRCTGTWEVTDGYGDQTTYIASFRYDDADLGGPEHAVSYLLDHNLRMVKGIWIGVPAESVVNGWREEAERDPDIGFREVAPEKLRGRVSRYLADTDELTVPPNAGYTEERAFGLARLERLPEPAEPVTRPELSSEGRDAVVADFLRAPEADTIGGDDGRPPTTAVAWGARAAVDFAIDENAGDPLRWSPTAVELLLLDWAPRQLSKLHEAAPWLPEVLDAFVRYAGRRRDRSDESVAATRDAITRSAVRYTDLMAGETLGEPVTDVLARMVDDGVDPMDSDAVLEWVLADRARRAAD